MFTLSAQLHRLDPPARKGTQHYFDRVTLQGAIRQQIERAVLDENRRLSAATS